MSDTGFTAPSPPQSESISMKSLKDSAYGYADSYKNHLKECPPAMIYAILATISLIYHVVTNKSDRSFKSITWNVIWIIVSSMALYYVCSYLSDKVAWVVLVFVLCCTFGVHYKTLCVKNPMSFSSNDDPDCTDC